MCLTLHLSQWTQSKSDNARWIAVCPSAMLVVWDAFAACENDGWNLLEIFGTVEPTMIGDTTKP